MIVKTRILAIGNFMRQAFQAYTRTLLNQHRPTDYIAQFSNICLLYTSDAADDLLCVDLGGRRVLQKKKNTKNNPTTS